MSYIGPNRLKDFVKKYFGDPKNIKGLGDGTVTSAIKAVSTKANTNATNISTVQGKANTNANNISSLTTKVNSHTSSISQINTDLSAIKNKKWLLFGDSLMAIEEGFISRVKAVMGSQVTVYAQGGMQWSINPPANYYCFNTMLDTWLPKISDKSSYTDILIELGSNDVANYNLPNLQTGLTNAIDKLKSNFPSAIIHIGIFGKNMLNSQWAARCNVIRNLKLYSGYRKAVWIEGSEDVLGGKNQTFDTIHPTESGHTYLASAFLSYMQGRNCPRYVIGEISYTSGLQGLQITEWYNEGKYFVKVAGTINNSSGITIPGTLGTIGTVIGKTSLPLCHRDISVSGFIQAKLDIFGTTVVHQIPCTIAIVPNEDETTTCTVMLVASYRDYYRDSSGAAQLWTDGFTFTQGIVNCAPACIDA